MYDAVGRVSCANTTSAPAGPLVGIIQNTAPSVVLNGVFSSQASRPRPGDIAKSFGALLSVMPTVSHESNSASALAV